MYLLPTGDLPTTTAVGFVFDEWNDFRPSSTQTTGLAINYDSPQCEAPHVMLLAVPPNDGLTAWTDAILAGIVQEAIRLTRVRALTSQTGRFLNLGLRAMNLVPPISGGKRGYERIPGRDVFVFRRRTSSLAGGSSTRVRNRRSWPATSSSAIPC